MSGLAEQQRLLLAALWQRKHSDAIEIIAAQVHPTRGSGQNLWERGLRAYRSNSQELAQRALAAAYPVVARLLEEDNFGPLARELWQRHPPLRGDLAQWGADLPALIESLPDLAEQEPYLADLARVEWALHAAATAADAQADAASFNLLATRDASAIRLCLGPGAACIASAFPVVSLVLAHEDAGQRLRSRVSETALIWRQGFKPLLREVGAHEAPFIAALQEKRSLLDSLAAAPRLDLNEWLAPAVQSGLVTGAREL